MSSVAVSDSPLSVSNGNVVTCPYVRQKDIDNFVDTRDGRELKFYLVGKGEKGINCGKFYASHCCENIQCSKPYYTRKGCHRKGCPDCYEWWKMREVDAIDARLYSEKVKKINGVRRLAHVIVSMKDSEEVKTKKDFNRMVQAAYKYAKKYGMEGGVIIIHAYRATSEAKYLAHQAGKKTWEWIRAQPHGERYQRYSPHFHILGYFDYLKKQKGGEKWMYKSITDGEGSIITFNNDNEGLRRTCNYLLSHTVDLKDTRFDSERWFGNCSKRVLSETEEEKEVKAAMPKENEVKYCKICGAPLIPFWDWIYCNYHAVMCGDAREPEYFQEVQENKWGDDPPEDAKNFVVGDVKEK